MKVCRRRGWGREGIGDAFVGRTRLASDSGEWHHKQAWLRWPLGEASPDMTHVTGVVISAT